MRVVIDTNVFVSGTFWKGPAHDIITLAEEGFFEVCATEDTLKEVFGVLARKKFLSLFHEAQVSYVSVVERIYALVTLYPVISISETSVKDPNDTMFLVCACSARADFLVSGDKNLLSMKNIKTTRIVTLKEFLIELRK